MTLWSYCLEQEQREVQKWAQYFPVYEEHFGRYINRPVIFMEIGCGRGGSLQMWKRYFGPLATIVGIDINPDCRRYEESQINVRIGPQQNHEFLSEILTEFGVPDVILDDGSHIMSDICSSFAYLYPRVSTNGLYMVEDLHTAYWEEFEGGYKKSGSFIELAKDLVDQLNADHIRDGLTVSEFTRTTMSLHFYDSMIVFERGKRPINAELISRR